MAWISCLILALLFAPPLRAQTVTVNGKIAIVRGGSAGSGKLDESNAVIWLTPSGNETPETPGSAAPAPKLRLVQHHKRFDPHVMVVPVASVVEFPNLDPFFHNVFSLFDGKRFDLGLYEAGSTHTVRFDRPGISYIFCNIHPEMSAVIVVLKTPFYALTDRSGEFHIAGVPAGRYLLSIWHERSQPESPKDYPRQITVSEGKSSLGTIRMIESTDPLANHKNKYGGDYVPPNPPNVLYEQP